MTKVSQEKERNTNGSENEGKESGMSMAPPAFNLTTDPVQAKMGNQPVQRQEAGEEGEEKSWWETITDGLSGFVSSVEETVSSWFGWGEGENQEGGQNQEQNPQAPTNQGPNPTPAPSPTPDPSTQTPATTTTVDVTGTVGDGGTNAPADVRAVQDRLHELGYLSDAAYTAEQVDASASGRIAETAMVQTLVAIGNFTQAAFGGPVLLIEPGQASESFLNGNLDHGLGNVTVGGNVGRGGANNAADVRAVQARLHTLGYLSDSDYQAEQVAADAQGQIAEANLAQTIAAINAFNVAVVGSSLYIIRPDGLEQTMLNNPPQFSVSIFSLTDSVGTGGANQPADVTAIQTRLNALGFLSDANRQAEAPDPTNQNPIPAGSLTETIAAINQFQHSMNLAQSGLVGVGDESHRQMMNPSLPEKGNVDIQRSVGRGGGVNQPADVRIVQDRLHAIGFLSTGDYLSERVDPAGTTNITWTNVPRTSAALDSFQEIVIGATDGRIDPGGKTERILNDPTYETLTTFNRNATNPDAAAGFSNNNAALTRIITAIEAGEGGHSPGEIPANLTNGAGVAASFGSAQMIGRTAVGTLQNNPDVASHYGLSAATLTDMVTRAANTNTHYDAIYNNVPAAGTDLATLNARIQAYTTANGQRFMTETGLYPDDIRRMYHTGNMRRIITAVNVPRGNDSSVTSAVNVNQEVTNLYANANFVASVNAIGVNRSSVTTYFRKTRTMGENRAAFQTKAIFNHPEGQKVRNAMSDGNGQSIGRTLIRDNFNETQGVVPQNQNNRDRVVAAVTALMHNSGGSAQSRYNNLNATLTDSYTVGFLARWDAL
ncbi:MAG: hypothetical protein H6581_15210 [Bacteroidia bacterium]|nr:hypothetical protein [Bacteroidia bacterium]